MREDNIKELIKLKKVQDDYAVLYFDNINATVIKITDEYNVFLETEPTDLLKKCLKDKLLEPDQVISEEDLSEDENKLPEKVTDLIEQDKIKSFLYLEEEKIIIEKKGKEYLIYKNIDADDMLEYITGNIDLDYDYSVETEESDKCEEIECGCKCDDCDETQVNEKDMYNEEELDEIEKEAVEYINQAKEDLDFFDILVIENGHISIVNLGYCYLLFVDTEMSEIVAYLKNENSLEVYSVLIDKERENYDVTYLPDSKYLSKFIYNGEDMTVIFKRGDVYTYYDVAPENYFGWIIADTELKDKSFREFVAPYKYEKVE